jgi:hypothetical protein
VVIALASRSNCTKRAKMKLTSKPVGLWARRGSNPFPGAKTCLYETKILVCGMKNFYLEYQGIGLEDQKNENFTVRDAGMSGMSKILGI